MAAGDRGNGLSRLAAASIERARASGDVVVVAARERERFQGSFGALLKEHAVTLAEEAGRFRAGFVIDRGVTRLNCTLDEEFRALAADAEIDISAALFAADQG